jgi:hypothetical protein
VEIVPPDEAAEGVDLASLVGHFVAKLDPSSDSELSAPVRRSVPRIGQSVRRARSRASVLAELASAQAVRHVFLKQFRDAGDGELAVLQQVVEARSSVTPGTLRWRKLRGTYDLSIMSLASHPLEQELGLTLEQTVRHAFAAEFGFRMESGVVRWP